MSEITWEQPPNPAPRRADRVAAQLRAKPGEWAKIATESAGARLFPWWGPIYNHDDYETRIVKHNRDEPLFTFGPRDIYARYHGDASRGDDK